MKQMTKLVKVMVSFLCLDFMLFGTSVNFWSNRICLQFKFCKDEISYGSAKIFFFVFFIRYQVLGVLVWYCNIFSIIKKDTAIVFLMSDVPLYCILKQVVSFFAKLQLVHIHGCYLLLLFYYLF